MHACQCHTCSTPSVRSAAARPLCSRPSSAADMPCARAGEQAGGRSPTALDRRRQAGLPSSHCGLLAHTWLIRLSSPASRSSCPTTAARLSNAEAPNSCRPDALPAPPPNAPSAPGGAPALVGEEDRAARAARASSGLRAMSLMKENCGAVAATVRWVQEAREALRGTAKSGRRHCWSGCSKLCSQGRRPAAPGGPQPSTGAGQALGRPHLLGCAACARRLRLRLVPLRRPLKQPAGGAVRVRH